MVKMENLSIVEEEIFKFIQASFHLSPHKLHPEFEILLMKLKKLEGNPYAVRAFAYLDIISWLESKIQGVHVKDILRKKYTESNYSKIGIH